MSTAALNGLFVGSVYGLFALGLVIVYRGSRVLNFAHGEIGMFGTFAFAILWTDHSVPLVLAIATGIAVSAVLGAGAYVAVMRPLREGSPLRAMVVTLGVAAFLLTFAGRWFGVQPRFVEPVVGHGNVRLGGLFVHPVQFLTLGCTVAVLVGFGLLEKRTVFGLRLRAVALDPGTAGQVGVHVRRVSFALWGLAGALAGASGILISSRVAFHVFFMTGLTLRGLAAALVGGLTNPAGAVAAGMLLGVAEGLLAFHVPVPGLTETAIALLTIGVLLLRPAGLVRSEY